MKKILLLSVTIYSAVAFAQDNVGINQANPNAKLHVTQETANDAFKVEDQTADPTPFTIDSSGNVGVQTATPTAELEVNGRIKDKTGFVMPVGCIMAYMGTTAPEGWLLCDGSGANRATYADLFAVLGETNGEGDGVTTFNLPDTRGRFIRGTDNGATNDPDAASRTAQNTNGNTGDMVGSLQTENTKSHNHSVDPPNTSTTTNGNHKHNEGNRYWTGNLGPDYGATSTSAAVGYQGGSSGCTQQAYTSTNGSHSHTLNIAAFSSASNGGNETRPVNVGVNYIIKY